MFSKTLQDPSAFLRNTTLEQYGLLDLRIVPASNISFSVCLFSSIVPGGIRLCGSLNETHPLRWISCFIISVLPKSVVDVENKSHHFSNTSWTFLVAWFDNLSVLIFKPKSVKVLPFLGAIECGSQESFTCTRFTLQMFVFGRILTGLAKMFQTFTVIAFFLPIVVRDISLGQTTKPHFDFGFNHPLLHCRADFCVYVLLYLPCDRRKSSFGLPVLFPGLSVLLGFLDLVTLLRNHPLCPCEFLTPTYEWTWLKLIDEMLSMDLNVELKAKARNFFLFCLIEILTNKNKTAVRSTIHAFGNSKSLLEDLIIGDYVGIYNEELQRLFNINLCVDLDKVIICD